MTHHRAKPAKPRRTTPKEKPAPYIPQVGDKVAITVTGYVTRYSGDDGIPTVEVTGHDGFQHYVYPFSGMNKLVLKRAAKPPVPAHPETRAGQVWVTASGFWFARRSAEGIPLRFTPDDLSDPAEKTTLAEDDFFRAYPDAVIVFEGVRLASYQYRSMASELGSPANGSQYHSEYVEQVEHAEQGAQASTDLTTLLDSLRGHGAF